jgi:DNA polymerase family A
MLREVGHAGLELSCWTPGERAHLRRLSTGSGSVASLAKFRDRIRTEWRVPGLERADEYRYVPVVAVEPLGTEIEMYDIEVFDESHSFVADGFITHNSSADITKLAMVLLDAALADLDACMINSVHDELVVECDAEVAEEARARVERAMTAAGREYIKSIPIVVDATVGEAWMK